MDKLEYKNFEIRFIKCLTRGSNRKIIYEFEYEIIPEDEKHFYCSVIFSNVVVADMFGDIYNKEKENELIRLGFEKIKEKIDNNIIGKREQILITSEDFEWAKRILGF